jgi:predicted ATPase/signal transduction histidine kinase
MPDLPGYSYRETLYQGTRHVVRRCTRERDGRPVIVKIPRADRPTLQASAALKHELEVARRLSDDRVVAVLGLETNLRGYALITEDFGGVSLRQWLLENPLSLEAFLRLAIRLADVLSCVHGAGIIHKDVKISNFIVGSDGATVKLTGFGIAAVLPRERSQLSATDSIEGTLAYMSPEQTGRMNRSLDHRSDLYSLGVTLYQVLTDRLPFTSEDPIELVYCHIAQEPRPPHQIDASIPLSVSRVIMKLLAKTAEERYQSAFGLRADLERCLTLWGATGTIDEFAPGARDISGRLSVPQKLYGRDRDVQALMKAFERTAAGAVELVLVSGYSGIGKSALVGEVSRPITARRGFFISGKFDQFRRDIPYGGILQAFRDLAHKLLTGSSERIEAWRTRLLEALGVNGQDIIALIPEIELIIGPQPALADHGSEQSQARFLETFRRFVRAFARADHPLVLFLDDLQWADGATLELLRGLVTDPELSHLMFLGAYRDNEVDVAHPLSLLLARLRDEKASITPLELGPLALADITRLLAETLQVAPAEALDLARIIAEKTLGNPFFVIEFLTTIHRDGLLSFDADRGHWRWDVGEIRRASLTENVVELMSARIGLLEENTRRVLMLAACMGSKFDLRSLSIVAERGPLETAAGLQGALEAEMIVPLDAGYKYTEQIEREAAPLDEGARLPSIQYRFRHDRILQAAYQRIPAETLPDLHLRIGRLSLRESSPLEIEERLFEIVNHLNAGIAVLHPAAERRELAELNLRAARKANLSSAYGPALALLATGIDLLPEASWSTDYELTFDLYLERAQAAYLTGAYDETARVVEAALAHARDVLDEAKLYEVLVLCYQHGGQFLRAIETAHRVLGRLGAPLPLSPTRDDVGAALMATMAELSGHKIEDLASLPDLTDAHRLAEMRLVIHAMSSAYFAAPTLFPLLVFRLMQLTIRHGLTSMSAYGFVTYGLLLVTILGDYDAGHRFGRLSLEIVERFRADSLRAKVDYVFAYFIRHYKEPLAACAAESQEAVQSGLSNGDIEFACYGMIACSLFALVLDDTLGAVAAKVERFHAAASRHKHVVSIATIGYVGRTVERLDGTARDAARWSASAWQAESGAAEMDVYDHCHRTMDEFLLGNPARALESAAIVERNFEAMTSVFYVPVFTFYHSLSCLAVCHDLTGAPREELLAKVEANQRRSAPWAPCNYGVRNHLVDAERARIEGRHPDAMRAYERAITLGRESGFIQDLALTYELCARFYLELGLDSVAHPYLRDAHHAYHRWGANAITARLEREFPGLLSTVAIAGAVVGAEPSTSLTLARLDLETMLRAARAISKEIVLSDLLRKLLSLALESAGARQAMLVLVEDGALVIAAESNAGVEEIPMLSLSPVEACPRLPVSIVNYAARTGADVVIDNAAVDGRFLDDPYVQRTQPASVLCAPLANQGKLIGVLYLEHSPATGVFTHQRVEMVRVMAGQAAIAIENARFYRDLDDRVKERTRELHASNEELSLTLSRLRETQRQLVAHEKLAALGALTAGIAHEIKNPLNFVVNFADLSATVAEELATEVERQRPRLEPDSRDYLQDMARDLQDNAAKISQHGRRADRIVQAMLEHSRTGTGAGEQREIDVNALLNESVRVAAHELGSQSAPLRDVITTDYDRDLLPLELSPQDLGRVLRNLMNNAVYAVSARRRELGEGFQPSIRVSTREIGERIEIRIRDNGGGVPPAIQERIFVPFFTTKPTGDGAGLGLSISREIVVESLGGTLSLEASEADHAELLVTLPRRRA